MNCIQCRIYKRARMILEVAPAVSQSLSSSSSLSNSQNLMIFLRESGDVTVTSSIVKNQFKLFTSAMTMATVGAQSGTGGP